MRVIGAALGLGILTTGCVVLPPVPQLAVYYPPPPPPGAAYTVESAPVQQPLRLRYGAQHLRGLASRYKADKSYFDTPQMAAAIFEARGTLRVAQPSAEVEIAGVGIVECLTPAHGLRPGDVVVISGRLGSAMVPGDIALANAVQADLRPGSAPAPDVYRLFLLTESCSTTSAR